MLQLLASELAYWFAHYCFHKIPALWEFHKVHHSAEVMTTLTELRQHPVEIIAFMNLIGLSTGIVFGVMTYAFGPGVRPFTLLNGNILLMAFLVTYGHLRHSHMWIAFTGFAGRILQSPAHHQLHHSANPIHYDRNLGFALAVWDWAFGTLVIPERTRQQIVFGVGGGRRLPFRPGRHHRPLRARRRSSRQVRRHPAGACGWARDCERHRNAIRHCKRTEAIQTAVSWRFLPSARRGASKDRPPRRPIVGPITNGRRAIAFLRGRAVPPRRESPYSCFDPNRNGEASVPGEKSARRRGVLLVLVATVLWSMAGLFARLLAHLDIWTVMGWRALLGAVSIAAVGLIEWRRGRLDNPFGFGPLSPVVALLAMIAISAYTASVMTTTIADVMVIYATLPFVAAAIGFLINGERVSPRTLAASGLALLGIVIMVASGLGSGRLLGQALSMLMTLAFAGMIVLQRRQPKASMIVVNCLGALGSGIFGLANSPLQPIGLHDFVILFVFGLTTIGLAFVIFMEGAKFIPSAEAGLISLLDVVLGPVWVFLAFGENPGLATMLGGAIVLAAAVWRMAPELRRERVIWREGP